jgi:hypothetical protein
MEAGLAAWEVAVFSESDAALCETPSRSARVLKCSLERFVDVDPEGLGRLRLGV